MMKIITAALFFVSSAAGAVIGRLASIVTPPSSEEERHQEHTAQMTSEIRSSYAGSIIGATVAEGIRYATGLPDISQPVKFLCILRGNGRGYILSNGNSWARKIADEERGRQTHR